MYNALMSKISIFTVQRSIRGDKSLEKLFMTNFTILMRINSNYAYLCRAKELKSCIRNTI